jgi:hypothetical protein
MALKVHYAYLVVIASLGLPPFIAAGEKPVHVDVGEPTLWTLEQAHYFLAKQRRKNRELETQWPNADKLDPNAIHGSRLDMLRTMFSASGGFDQTIGASNAESLETHRGAVDRRRVLTERLDAYRERSIALTDQLSDLDRQLGALNAERQKELVQQKEADIKAITRQQAEIKANIDATKAELDATPATPSNLKSIELENKAAEQAAKSIIESNSASSWLREPRLHASTVLDNFVQMQYEVIAKQLTLLRDDVGLENRLVFLELPVSIYTASRRSADNKLVQTRYELVSYARCKTPEEYAAELKLADVEVNNALASATPETKIALENCDLPGPKKGLIALENLRKSFPFGQAHEQLVEPLMLNHYFATRALDVPKEKQFDSAEASRHLKKYGSLDTWVSELTLKEGIVRGETPDPIKWNIPFANQQRASRVVDLIPRQSALNVNAVHDKVSSINLMGFFRLISGWGLKTEYQRQSEHFEQFVHQEIFASAFGKGRRDFGWTFGPNPGSRRIAPGVRTTFAVVVVPRSARGITLRMKGCTMKRSSPAPDKDDCIAGPSSGLVRLEIPQENEGFFFDKIRYTTARAGEPITVFLSGRHFSPQIGVLVDGVPLSPQVGIASNAIAPAEYRTSGDDIRGDFEYVNQSLVVLRFSMPPSYTGTPRITLVTPQKAAEINRFKLEINDVPGRLDCTGYPTTPEEVARLKLAQASQTTSTPGANEIEVCVKGAPMFNSVAIQSVQLVSVDNSKDPVVVLAHVVTRGIDTAEAPFTINGVPAERAASGDGFVDLRFPAPSRGDWTFAVRSDKSKATKTIGNLLQIKLSDAEPVTYIVDGGTAKERMSVTLRGSGFDPALDKVTSPEKARLVATKIGPETIVLEIDKPLETEHIMLERKGTPYVLRWDVTRPKK